VVKAYIHRDKIKCAIDLLEKGASQREIAKTCGLSMSQVSAIGREYGYYVDVEEYFEKLKEERKREYEALRKSILEERKKLEAELRELSERLKALRDEEKVRQRSVEDLKHAEEYLNEKIALLLPSLDTMCSYYKVHRDEAEKRMESLEKVIGEDVWKFLEKIEALIDPGLIEDLRELRRALDYTTVAKDRERLKAKFEKVEKALESLMVLLAGGEYFTDLMALTQLRDVCSVIDELKRASRREAK